MVPSATSRADLGEMNIDILVADLGIASAGNSVTANRYREIFDNLGHHSTITDVPTSQVVVALNAYRTSAAAAMLATDTTLIAVLTGTDVYRFWDTDREAVATTLHRASVIVGLNDKAGLRLPKDLKAKVITIKEGAVCAPASRTHAPRPPLKAIAVGHLREEKDPKLLIEALNLLGPHSSIRVDQYGAAHSQEWADWARQISASDPRFKWHGEVPRSALNNVYANAHVLINTSQIEGGANVISEAVMSGLPILATAIDGNTGVLGSNYPGLVTPGDAAALTEKLRWVESDPDALGTLANASRALQDELSVDQETKQWRLLLNGLSP